MCYTQTDMPADSVSEMGEKLIVSDPRELFRLFRESRVYKDEYAQFYTKKIVNSTVTPDEMRQVFEEDNFAHAAFFKFTHHQINFRYDPAKFPAECTRLTNEHIKIARDRKKVLRGDNQMSQDERQTLDQMLAAAHNAEAKSFAQNGITPTEKLGRALSSLILICEGLQTFNSASKSQIERIQWVHGLKSLPPTKIGTSHPALVRTGD